MVTIRELTGDEYPRALAFCAERPYERINLRVLVEANAGTVAIAEDRGAVVALVVRASHGAVVISGSDAVADAAVRAVGTGRGAITAIMGTPENVSAVRTALGLDERSATLDREESVMGLALTDAPDGVRGGVRRADASEIDRLAELRVAYWQEAFAMTIDEPARTRARAEVSDQVRRGRVWVLAEDGEITGCMAVQVERPDIVVIGAGYVAPAARNRGALRALVGTSLAATREAGVAHAVFFTANPATLRSMARMGFVEVARNRGLIF